MAKRIASNWIGLIEDPSLYNASPADFETVRTHMNTILQDALQYLPAGSVLTSTDWRSAELVPKANPSVALSFGIQVPAYGKAALIGVHVYAVPADPTRWGDKKASWYVHTVLYAIDDRKVWTTLARYLKPTKRGGDNHFVTTPDPQTLIQNLGSLRAAFVKASKAMGN